MGGGYNINNGGGYNYTPYNPNNPNNGGVNNYNPNNPNNGGVNNYNPLTNAQQIQNNAPAVSTSIGSFNTQDPTAFLTSIGNQVSSILKGNSGGTNIPRSDFRAGVNIDPALAARLNITVVDPPPAYNNYGMQGGYNNNVPYPNQGYGQGGGQQLVPVFTQTANGPQITGYVAVQTQQQATAQPPFVPQYNANQNFQPNFQSYNYGNTGQMNYPANFQASAYGNVGQTSYPPNANPISAWEMGQTNAATGYEEFTNPDFMASFRPASLNRVYDNAWLASSEAADLPDTEDSDEMALDSLKDELETLKSTKSALRKQLRSEQLSPDEKEAVTSQIEDIKQQERQLRAEIRSQDDGQPINKSQSTQRNTVKKAVEDKSSSETSSDLTLDLDSLNELMDPDLTLDLDSLDDLMDLDLDIDLDSLNELMDPDLKLDLGSLDELLDWESEATDTED